MSHDLSADASPIGYLSLLLPETFFSSVANETNSYAYLKQEIKGCARQELDKINSRENQIVYIPPVHVWDTSYTRHPCVLVT